MYAAEYPTGREEAKSTRRKIVDTRVPVGGKTFTLDSTGGLKIGDQIMVVRNTNAKWLHEIGMDHIPGPPGPSAVGSSRAGAERFAAPLR